ncbi:MAG: DNA-binding protein [Actinomycetaceae bacterium]|nr:DNA-binding protein [Actinomycetaceae bacterium]
MTEGLVPISAIAQHQRVKTGGVVRSLTYPSAGAAAIITATLWDGQASVDLRWLGRRTIPGIRAGAHLEVEGVVGRYDGHLAIVNPLYRLVVKENL